MPQTHDSRILPGWRDGIGETNQVPAEPIAFDDLPAESRLRAVETWKALHRVYFLVLAWHDWKELLPPNVDWHWAQTDHRIARRYYNQLCCDLAILCAAGLPSDVFTHGAAAGLIAKFPPPPDVLAHRHSGWDKDPSFLSALSHPAGWEHLFRISAEAGRLKELLRNAPALMLSQSATAVAVQSPNEDCAALWGKVQTPADPAKAEANRPPADPFAVLLDFAAEHLKGNERAAVELVCQNGDGCPLRTLGLELQWERPYDGAVNALRGRLNKKLKAANLPFRFSRHNNALRVDPLPSRKA